MSYNADAFLDDQYKLLVSNGPQFFPCDEFTSIYFFDMLYYVYFYTRKYYAAKKGRGLFCCRRANTLTNHVERKACQCNTATNPEWLSQHNSTMVDHVIHHPTLHFRAFFFVTPLVCNSLYVFIFEASRLHLCRCFYIFTFFSTKHNHVSTMSIKLIFR